MQFNQVIIRCELYPDEVGKAFVTKALSAKPKMWRGAQVEFQFAVFKRRQIGDTAAELYDISNIAGLPQIRIRTANAAGTVLLDNTAAGAVIEKDESLDLDSWADGSKQHFRMYFPESATGITAGSQYIVIYGPDGDVFGTSVIEVTDPGTGAAASPEPAAEGYYTKSEVRAILEDFMRLVGEPGQTRALTSADGRWRVVEELISDGDGVRIAQNFEEVQNPQA
jgi:hypothetical protein